MSRNQQELFRRAEASGQPQSVFAAEMGISESLYTRAKQGQRRLPQGKLERFATTLIRMDAVGAKYPGVPIDFSDPSFREREFRKLEGGSLEIIPQTNGSHFIQEFCKLAAILPEEFVASAQLAPTVIGAPIITIDGQTWIRLWATWMERVLEDKPFPEFVAKHDGDRRKALTTLANESFARILASEGRERVLALMTALLRNRELKAASSAASGKN